MGAHAATAIPATAPLETPGWVKKLPLIAAVLGDAVNYLTATAGLGGEFVRAHYLRHQASAKALAASVSVAKLTQFAGQALEPGVHLL